MEEAAEVVDVEEEETWEVEEGTESGTEAGEKMETVMTEAESREMSHCQKVVAWAHAAFQEGSLVEEAT